MSFLLWQFNPEERVNSLAAFLDLCLLPSEWKSERKKVVPSVVQESWVSAFPYCERRNEGREEWRILIRDRPIVKPEWKSEIYLVQEWKKVKEREKTKTEFNQPPILFTLWNLGQAMVKPTGEGASWSSSLFTSFNQRDSSTPRVYEVQDWMNLLPCNCLILLLSLFSLTFSSFFLLFCLNFLLLRASLFPHSVIPYVPTIFLCIPSGWISSYLLEKGGTSQDKLASTLPSSINSFGEGQLKIKTKGSLFPRSSLLCDLDT